MKIAMMQPSFMPWLGFFELIAKVDKFVVLDDFQFVYQSYHQKNRLFSSKEQVDWYIVPIDKKNSFKKPINEVIIKDNINWREKMWRRFEANYKKSKYFNCFSEELKNIILCSEYSLLKQNLSIINFACRILGYEDKFVYSSNLKCEGKRSELINNILLKVGASEYYSAQGSFEYMYEDGIFPSQKIEVLFQNFKPKPYFQIGSTEFTPYLSIIDALFNIGPEETKVLVESGTEVWLKWDDMISILKKEGRCNNVEF